MVMGLVGWREDAKSGGEAADWLGDWLANWLAGWLLACWPAGWVLRSARLDCRIWRWAECRGGRKEQGEGEGRVIDLKRQPSACAFRS